MTTAAFRYSFILQEIENKGTVSVVELANSLDVSEMTIRRDLSDLEKQGSIRRVHGGAVSAQGRSFEPPFVRRAAQATVVKQKIGLCAAHMVADGDSIALDVGSTLLEMARHLVGRRNLTIITPSLWVANLFINEPDIRLILPGGIVRPGEASLIGNLAEQVFKELFVDRLFLGIGCIDAEVGLTEFNLEDAQIKKTMIRSAKEIIVVADATKYGKVAFAHVANFNQIHKLITDQLPPEPILKKLTEANVKVIVADENIE